MKYVFFSLEKPLKYHQTGKFQAPSQEWKHLQRILTDYELIVVTEGTAYIQLEGTQYSISPGEFLLCAPALRQFGFRTSCCVFYWLHFNSEKPTISGESNCFPSDVPEKQLCIPLIGKVPNLEKLIVLLKHLQDDARSYGNEIQEDYLCTSVLCELYCQFQSNRNGELALRQKQIFYDIKDYVKWNSSTDLRVAEVAVHFGYNKRYLSSLFRTAAGISLKEYITQQKLEEAKYLLCDTNDTVTSIAGKLGYSDSHHFMKVFKVNTGLTPSQYRNAYAGRLLFYK